MQQKTIDEVVLHLKSIAISGASAIFYADCGIPPSDTFLAVRQLLNVGEYEDLRLIAEYPDLFQQKEKSSTEYMK